MKVLFAFAVLIVAVAAGGYYDAAPYAHAYHAAPATSHIYHEQQNDGYGYGTYNFGYDVNDPYHYNSHSRHESKDGYGTIRGSYKLHESDGSVRVVDYVADKYGGFRALVNGVPHGFDDGYY